MQTNVIQSEDRSSWNIELDDCVPTSDRWVWAVLFPYSAPEPCWLQAKDPQGGFWVQFDPEAPYRWVPEIKSC